MGYSDVSLGVEMKHLEGPKNPNGLSLGIYVFIYVYKLNGTHQSVYVHAKRWDEILDWQLVYFNIFFFRKRKAKDVNANHQ